MDLVDTVMGAPRKGSQKRRLSRLLATVHLLISVLHDHDERAGSTQRRVFSRGEFDRLCLL